MRGVALSGELRAGRDEDGAEIIALIGRCWADYPGVVLDVDGEEPHLRALATYYAAQGGILWVAPGVLGMIAVVPRGDRVWEVCKVYVHPDLHGGGLGHVLMDAAEGHAAAAGARVVEVAQRGIEPNDRRFGRDAERLVTRLRPEVLDALLRDGDSDS